MIRFAPLFLCFFMHALAGFSANQANDIKPSEVTTVDEATMDLLVDALEHCANAKAQNTPRLTKILKAAKNGIHEFAWLYNGGLLGCCAYNVLMNCDCCYEVSLAGMLVAATSLKLLSANNNLPTREAYDQLIEAAIPSFEDEFEYFNKPLRLFLAVCTGVNGLNTYKHFCPEAYDYSWWGTALAGTGLFLSGVVDPTLRKFFEYMNTDSIDIEEFIAKANSIRDGQGNKIIKIKAIADNSYTIETLSPKLKITKEASTEIQNPRIIHHPDRTIEIVLGQNCACAKNTTPTF